MKRWFATRAKLTPIVKKAPLKPLDHLKPRYGSALMDYIQSTMKKYPDALVVTQVGSFYELYFDQAMEFGPKLDLKIANKRQHNPITGQLGIPMTGFPTSQITRYAKILVQDMGRNVVLLSQDRVQVLKKSPEHLKRPITRVLTPGTYFDQVDDTWQHNYVVTIAAPQLELLENDTHIALAWADMTDGSIQYQPILAQNLMDELARISPREVVVNKGSNIDPEHFYTSTFSFPPRDTLASYHYLFDDSSEQTIKLLADKITGAEASALVALLAYMEETNPQSQFRYQVPALYTGDKVLQIDRISRDALELFRVAQRDSVEGSLGSVVRKTVTASGSRLLETRLASPSRDIAEINSRLDAVERLRDDEELRLQLVGLLKQLPDVKRVIQKLSLSKPQVNEIVNWEAAITILRQIEASLRQTDHCIFRGWQSQLRDQLTAMNRVYKDVHKTITNGMVGAMPDEFVKGRRAFGSVVNAAASQRLGDLLSREAAARQEIFKQMDLAASRVCSPDIPSSFQFNPHNGFYLNARTTSNKLSSLDKVKVLSHTTASVSFTTLGIEKAGSAYDAIIYELEACELEILDQLRHKILTHASSIRVAADIADNLDVSQGLASLSLSPYKTFCRPKLLEEPGVKIEKGWNLTVEAGLAKEGKIFIANDCWLTSSQQICVVTGPNMGGKSTYLRQVAITCLLAQAGSFVPAERAEIGVLDRIFCRLGSGDDISRGRSTFMVEMLETANVLKQATVNSLAIMDEVGRGTSEKDGIAIAYATMKHIIENNQCTALFSTHYGPELYTALEKADMLPRVVFYQTAPYDKDGQMSYDYVLKNGVCESAHGLRMAELAGFPDYAMRIAKNIYSNL